MTTKLTFALFATLLLFSCKKDENNLPTPKTDYYFFADLDGKQIALEIGTSNQVDMQDGNVVSLSGTLCKIDFGSVVVCTATGSTNPDQPDFDLQFLSYFSGACDEVAPAFPGIFKTGNYGFGSGVGNMQVRMWDGTNYWVSDPAKQPGDAFLTINTSESVTWNGQTARKLVGKGNCVLFDSQGNSKKLKNLQFSVAILQP